MEITANAVQTVEQNQNVLFTETVTCGNGCIRHREGSGLVSMLGNTCQCRALYRAYFNANIAIPTGGTAEEISLAIALDGEPLQSTRMRVTPAAVENYFNVSASTEIPVPRGSNASISVENISTQSVLVQNANLITERKA